MSKFFTNLGIKIRSFFSFEARALEADIKTAIADAKVTISADVKAAAPVVQAAVAKEVGVIEQAVLAAIEARLGA